MAVSWVTLTNIVLEISALFLHGFTLAYVKFKIEETEDPILFGSIILFLLISLAWFLYFFNTKDKIERIVHVIRILESFGLFAVGSLIIYYATEVETSNSCKNYDKSKYGDCQQFIIKIVAGSVLLLDGLLHWIPPPKHGLADSSHGNSNKQDEGSFWQIPVIAIPRARLQNLRDKLRGTDQTTGSPVSNLMDVQQSNPIGPRQVLSSPSAQLEAPVVDAAVPGESYTHPNQPQIQHVQQQPGGRQVPFNGRMTPFAGHQPQQLGLEYGTGHGRFQDPVRSYSPQPPPSVLSLGTASGLDGESNMGYQFDPTDPSGRPYHHEAPTAINQYVRHDPGVDRRNYADDAFSY